MKYLLLLSAVLFGTTVQAKNYYISTQGSNANNGLAPTTPWQTIAKLNASFSIIMPGDSILFKSGEIFYGSIVVTKSGTSTLPIIISKYGTGAKPIITGFTTLSAWASIGNGIYEAGASAKSTVNLVTLNNLPQAVGRYPNADAANGGYLSYESFTGTTSITDNQLNGATNWAGAEVIIRKNHWWTEKCKITSQSGSTLSYTTTPPINPLNNATPVPMAGTNGYGYFIQRDARTLDQLGEWYFNNATKKLQMFFGTNAPSSYVTKISTVDTLINLGSKSYINISNLAFEGANLTAIYGASGGYIAIQACDMNLMGAKGIFIFNSPNTLVDHVNINYALCNAIDITSRHQANATVRNCVIKNTGTLAGMAPFWDGNDYKGMVVTVTTGGLIEYNEVDTTGFVGLEFQGSNFTIKNNFINYYGFVKDDGGGIYTFQAGTDAAPGTIFTNRSINGNIVMNGIGAGTGAGDKIDIDGIYLDGRTMNVDLQNNTSAFIGVNGIYSNNAGNVNIRGNTSYGNGSAIGLTKYSWGSITNLTVKHNIFYPKYATQNNLQYANMGVNVPVPTTIQAAMQNIGQIDSNFYAIPNSAGFNYFYALTDGGAYTFPTGLSFDGWKSYTSHDTYTKLPPKALATYQINSLLTPNIITNGAFTTNMAGIGNWSTNATTVWDNTGKITGAGSLKTTPTIPGTGYTYIYGDIGAVSSTKKYILRFTTLGTADNKLIGAYLRQAAAPQTMLAPVQMRNYGTTKIVHEFLFTGPISQAAASFLIEVQQSAGTTYIDDIQFYEADVTLLNVDDQLRFEFNPTNVAKTINLGAKYLGIDSTVYNGTITLAPYTSSILMNAGAIDIALKVDAGTDISVILPTNNTVLKGTIAGNVTSYTWTKISGPDQYAIANPNNLTTAVSNLSAGKYTFQLKVISTNGDSALATVNVIATGILPVTLIDFSAKNNNDKVALQWQTASEINVSHYAIERSGTGKVFENIGQLNSNNLRDIQSNYNFADNFPLKGVNYYRLVMIDKDGSITYSKTVSVSIKNAVSFTLINLSLSSSNTTIKMGINSNYQQKMNVVVVDVSGRIIVTLPVQLQKGFNAIDSKIPSINTGIYYVKLFTNDESINQAILSSH